MRWNRIFRLLVRDKLGLIGIVLMTFFVLMAILAPVLITHDPHTQYYSDDGQLLSLTKPSSEHWLGTTKMGRDIFSQVIVGSRVALLVGFTSAIMVTIIGTAIALIAG